MILIHKILTMPDWCYNIIKISSDVDKGKFKAFCDSLKNEHGDYIFSFNTHVPRPTSEDNNQCYWGYRNWGTKWDAQEVDVSMLNGNLYVNCSTAWTPPIEWARKTSIDFGVKIKISYETLGMNFQGEYSRSSVGEVDKSWEIEDSDEVESCHCGEPCDEKPVHCSCNCHAEV